MVGSAQPPPTHPAASVGLSMPMAPDAATWAGTSDITQPQPGDGSGPMVLDRPATYAAPATRLNPGAPCPHHTAPIQSDAASNLEDTRALGPGLRHDLHRYHATSGGDIEVIGLLFSDIARQPLPMSILLQILALDDVNAHSGASLEPITVSEPQLRDALTQCLDHSDSRESLQWILQRHTQRLAHRTAVFQSLEKDLARLHLYVRGSLEKIEAFFADLMPSPHAGKPLPKGMTHAVLRVGPAATSCSLPALLRCFHCFLEPASSSEELLPIIQKHAGGPTTVGPSSDHRPQHDPPSGPTAEIPGMARHLRSLLHAWCVEHEAWGGLRAAVGPVPTLHWTSWTESTSTGWGGGRLALIRSFFVAMNSSDMRNWCQQTLGRFQDLVSFTGDRLFGPTNPISEQRGARGRAPPTSSRLWQMYARIDKPLTDVTSEAPTAAGIPGLCSLDPSPAPHLSRLQSDWLSLLCTTGAFSRPQDGYNVLLWNLGPHGFEASRIQVEALFAENRSVICLQDLRIPKRKCQEIKEDLERRFHYKIFISTAQVARKVSRRNGGYHFTTLTALHKDVVSSSTSFVLGDTGTTPGTKNKHLRYSEAGRTLCLSATLHSGQRIHVLNVYQFTAAHPSRQRRLWSNLERWIRKHKEDKIVLLGDFNSTYPAGRGLHGVTWRNVGRYRQSGLSELTQPELSDALRPNGNRWRECSDPSSTGPVLSPRTNPEPLISETDEFSPADWLSLGVPNLCYTDRLRVGTRLLEPAAPKRHTFSMDQWAELSPPLGLCWEVIGHAKPSHGEEICNDALRALLRSHLELSQRDLDNLNLKVKSDSFIHLCPENLFLRPIAHAPPPSRCFLRAAGHIFVPDGQLGALRSGYSRPLHSTIQRADTMFASFLSRTGGSWTPASGHTWKNQQGKAATLDHAVLWNLVSDLAPKVRWPNMRGQATPGTSDMKHDHAQLLISLDHSVLPLPPPPKAKPCRAPTFDPVLFKSLQPRWQREVATLVEGPLPTPTLHPPGVLYWRHQEDCQTMLAAALRLQARARASNRRKKERPPDRSKQQTRVRRDLLLLEAALKETALSLANPSGGIPRATRRALQLLHLGQLTIAEAELIWSTLWWKTLLLREMDTRRDHLSVIAKAQAHDDQQSLRRKYHWLFDNGIKGVRKVLGKFGPQGSLSSARQRCPNGLFWKMRPDACPDTILQWTQQLPIDPAAHQLHWVTGGVSITVHVLTDLLPLTRNCLRLPLPMGLLPPSLTFHTGPWHGENLMTALEFFFQTNAYHPAASCHRCLHQGGVPLTALVSEGSDEEPDPMTAHEASEAELDGAHPALSEATATVLAANQTHQDMPPSPMALDAPSAGHADPAGPGPGPQSHLTLLSTRGQYTYANVPPTSRPIHRRIIHLCEKCLERGEKDPMANFRHNRRQVASMEFLDKCKIFNTRVIPKGESITAEVSPQAFARYLNRLAARKACGQDEVPAEILKNGPAPFRENLRLLINEVLQSRCKLGPKLLDSKVVLIHKKGDQESLRNYRPIALLTSTYQLINIILADRLQALAEKHRLLESSQFGFRWLTGVSNSVQKQNWLLKLASTGDGTLIRIDLDYRNAFNSAGHACLWAVLEKFGVPDIQLLKDFYDQASMRICAGAETSAGIFMDTGTAQGSALSPLLFILFINALLRLFDQSGVHHGVKGAPSFNHLAFADDLSLYVTSQRDADILLQRVKAFEDWSGLQISRSKSFATGSLNGAGAARRAADARRHHQVRSTRAESTTAPAHACDLLAMEEDDEGNLLRFQTQRPDNRRIRCSQCTRTKSAKLFRHYAETLEDGVSTCLACRAEWTPSGINYGGEALPVIPGSTPTRFLGIHGDMRGDCSAQISIVFQQTASIVAFLQERKLSPRQGLSLVSMTLPSFLRFTGSLVPWSKPQLRKLDRLWMHAYKLALWISVNTASCLLKFPDTMGGRGLATPLGILCQAVWGHLERCCMQYGGLFDLAREEYKESLTSLHCSSLSEVQTAIKHRQIPWQRTMENRFTFACFLSLQLEIQVEWDPFAPDTLRSASFTQLAQLLLQHGTELAIPGGPPEARYGCESVDELSGTSTWRDRITGQVVTLHRAPGAGHLEHSSLRDIITLNFPAARDLAQLQALVSGTPLCETHGSSRTEHQLAGVPFLAVTKAAETAEAASLSSQENTQLETLAIGTSSGPPATSCTVPSANDSHEVITPETADLTTGEALALTDPLVALGAASPPSSGAQSPAMPPSEEEEPYALAHPADRQEEHLDYLASLTAVDTDGDEREPRLDFMASPDGTLLGQSLGQSATTARTESDRPPAPGREVPLDPSPVIDRRRQPGALSDDQADTAMALDAPGLPNRQPLPAAENALSETSPRDDTLDPLTESEALDILRSFDVSPSFGPSSSWTRSARIARLRLLKPNCAVPPPVLAALARFPHLDGPPGLPLATNVVVDDAGKSGPAPMAPADGGLLRQNSDQSEATTRTEFDPPPAPDQEMPLDPSLVNGGRRQPGDHSDDQTGAASARDAPALPSRRPLLAAQSAPLGASITDDALNTLTESEALDILRSFDVSPSFGPSSSWTRSARIARVRHLAPKCVVPSPVLAALARFPHLDVPPGLPLATRVGVDDAGKPGPDPMASANGGLLRQNPDKSAATTRSETDLPPAPDQEMPLDPSPVNDRRRQPGDHSDDQADVATARDAPVLPSRRLLPAAESAIAAGRATVSWTKATAALRENLLTLQQKLKEDGHLAAKEQAELARLLQGQTAFDTLLQPLIQAGYTSLLDVPRTVQGPASSRRFCFRLPLLPGTLHDTRTLASEWLSRRDDKDWASLGLSGLSGHGTIEPWLARKPPQKSAPIPDLHYAINKMTRMLTSAEALDFWSKHRELPAVAAASPNQLLEWRQSVDDALTRVDWADALARIRDDMGPIQPRCPPRERRPRRPSGSTATMVDLEGLGLSFVSQVLAHRPEITGRRWESCGGGVPLGTQIFNPRLTELLRRGGTLSQQDWESTGIRDLPRDAVFAITGGQVNLHGSCSMFFRPKPEPILSAQFQCVINAPTERRLRELWACWDEGSATGALALRQALLRGQDLLLMPADWWPNFQCPRRHGWWVRALSEVQVQLCSKCRNITALPDFRCTGSPCLRCEQGIRPSPGSHRDRASFFRPAGTKRDRPIVRATSTTQSRKVKRQRRGSTLHRHPVTSPAESASDPETDHHDTIQAADSEDDWGLAEAGIEDHSPLAADVSIPTVNCPATGPTLRPRPAAKRSVVPPRRAAVSRRPKAASGPPPNKTNLTPRVKVSASPQIGLWLRTADPSLARETSLQGDTCLAMAQAAACIQYMLSLALQSGATSTATPWHTDWLTSSEMGFPLVDDGFHRGPHPLVHQYCARTASEADMTLLPILRFGMDKDNQPCGICNRELADKPCDQCDLCRSKYHSSCLQWLADHPGDGESQNLDCPRCDGSLDLASARFFEDTSGTQAPSAPWEHFSIPAKALDPPLLPEGPAHSTADEARAMIARPPPGGYVKIFAEPLEFVDDWYGQAVSSQEGISRFGDNVLQLACARWHFLKTVAGPAMKQELIPFLVAEARYQQVTDLASSSFNISWRILEAAQRVFGAGVFRGESAVTAPPFFPTAGRGNLTYWNTGPETAPSVVCLAGSSPEEVEATLPHLQGRTDWVVLTPPLSDDSPALAFLALHGRQILTGSGSSFRTRGWWKTGGDELAKYSTNLDCWIAREAKPERDKIEALGRTLCQNLSNEPPFLDTTKLGLIFRAGTEAGLLGLHDPRLAVYATDGSLEDNVMGAGVYVAHSRAALSAKIGRSSEARTSLRVETGASFLALENGKDTPAPIFILTDSANHLTEVDNWVGEGKSPTLSKSKDSDILRAILELLHHRARKGLPTFFIKIRAHRGEPFNEAADRIAGRAGSEEGALLWNAPSGRPIFRFTTTSEDGSESIYRACMNDTIKKQIKHRAALIDCSVAVRPSGRCWTWTSSVRPCKGRELTCPSLSAALRTQLSFTKAEWDLFCAPILSHNDFIRADDGDYYKPAEEYSSITEAFLRRPHSSRDLLGRCLADSTFPDAARRRLLQSVSGQFPCRANLFRWNIEKSPNCPRCKERESFGHIQSRCPLLEAPRTAAHHLIWREILLCLARFSAPTKDSEWEFPSTGTMDNHKEGTIKHILLLPSLNLPWDDLEGEVRCFLSHRTNGFWAQYQALIDQNDPTSFCIPQDERPEILDKLRFTTLQLDGSTLRNKDPTEIDDTVKAFLNLRPDGFALNVKKQEIALLEFTRAMDTDVQWEARKDAEKRRRYAPVLDFFNASHKRASWTMSQINFTVGVRGSISTADILERVGQWTHSFVSSLERLGVSRKLDIERTRKAVAKRTFEAHDLMLRSYYAVKSSPSGQVDFSKIRTNSVALQHRIRPRLKTTR